MQPFLSSGSQGRCLHLVFFCKHRGRGTLTVLYTVAPKAYNLFYHESWSTVLQVPRDISLIRKIKLYIAEQN